MARAEALLLVEVASFDYQRPTGAESCVHQSAGVILHYFPKAVRGVVLHYFPEAVRGVDLLCFPKA